jgi:hypothetical protein
MKREANEMKFKINYLEPKADVLIRYNPMEYSFDYRASGVGITDACLLINDLELSINTQTNFVCGVSGLNCHLAWKKANITFPNAENGKLLVCDKLESGDVFRIKSGWTTYFDCSKKCICFGKKDLVDCKSVRFGNNIVASLENEDIAALWIQFTADTHIPGLF